jgi:carbonic anhydrase
LGQEQTPINIDTASTLSHKHTDLFLHYTAHTGLSFLNNGATLIVPMPITHQYVNKRPGIMAEFEGIPYYLEDFRFKSPAEHSVNGEQFPLEMQLTHRSEGDLATARFFRVLLLFRLSETCNPKLAALNWVKLPRNKGETRAIPDGFRLVDMFPADLAYYSYDGSLSRPPCTEGVLQAVIRTPMTVCARQLEEYRFAIPLPNNRPVQPLHGREVNVGSVQAADGETDSFWSWGYSSLSGPSKWGRYFPECRGKEQSPVVIITSEIDDRGSGDENKRLSFDWAPRCRVQVRNTGRALVLQIYAGFTIWEGQQWRVVRVEFHAGSEHQVDGKQFPMEMQIVHTNTEGAFMILSVLYDSGTISNRFLQSLGWENLPGLPLVESRRQALGTRTEEQALDELSANVFHPLSREPPAETESVLSR